MKLETMREQVRTVAQRWCEQYSGKYGRGSKPEILRKLNSIDVQTATDADVAAIIGNGIWVSPKSCHECKAITWDTVELGEHSDYDRSTAVICIDCLRKAVELADSNNRAM